MPWEELFMTGAMFCKWNMFHPVFIYRLKHGCTLPQISVAKEESLNGRDVRWCCLCTAFSLREAHVSNTVRLLRALPPDCSTGVANFCHTLSPFFSRCPSCFCKRKEYLWSSLEYYPFFRNYTLALILLDNYGRFAVISCLLTIQVTGCHHMLVSCKSANQLIGEKCVSKAHKCGYEITQWSSWVHVNLQAVFFSSFPYLWLKWAFGDVTLTDVIFFAVRFAVLQHDNCNIHSKRASPMLWEDHW